MSLCKPLAARSGGSSATGPLWQKPLCIGQAPAWLENPGCANGATTGIRARYTQRESRSEHGGSWNEAEQGERRKCGTRLRCSLPPCFFSPCAVDRRLPCRSATGLHGLSEDPRRQRGSEPKGRFERPANWRHRLGARRACAARPLLRPAPAWLPPLQPPRGRGMLKRPASRCNARRRHGWRRRGGSLLALPTPAALLRRLLSRSPIHKRWPDAPQGGRLVGAGGSDRAACCSRNSLGTGGNGHAVCCSRWNSCVSGASGAHGSSRACGAAQRCRGPRRRSSVRLCPRRSALLLPTPQVAPARQQMKTHPARHLPAPPWTLAAAAAAAAAAAPTTAAGTAPGESHRPR